MNLTVTPQLLERLYSDPKYQPVLIPGEKPRYENVHYPHAYVFNILRGALEKYQEKYIKYLKDPNDINQGNVEVALEQIKFYFDEFVETGFIYKPTSKTSSPSSVSAISLTDLIIGSDSEDLFTQLISGIETHIASINPEFAFLIARQKELEALKSKCIETLSTTDSPKETSLFRRVSLTFYNTKLNDRYDQTTVSEIKTAQKVISDAKNFDEVQKQLEELQTKLLPYGQKSVHPLLASLTALIKEISDLQLQFASSSSTPKNKP
jgi:hypothetical protein